MQEVRVVRLEPFPDLDDEVVYPRLTERKLEWLEKVMNKKGGERRTFQEGDVLYEHAVRDAPFFVLLTGRVEFVDRKPGKDVHVAAADRGHLHRRHRRLHRRADDQRRGRHRGDRGARLRARAAARDGRRLARVRRTDLPHAAGAARLARRNGLRGAAADRAAELAPVLRSARPARTQPLPGPLVRRRHRPRVGRDAQMARDPARGNADPPPRADRDAQPLAGPGRA